MGFCTICGANRIMKGEEPLYDNAELSRELDSLKKRQLLILELMQKLVTKKEYKKTIKSYEDLF